MTSARGSPVSHRSRPADSLFGSRARIIFCGRWIKHGGFWPDPQASILPARTQDGSRAAPSTRTFESSRQDAAVVRYGALIHHSYPTLSDYIEHMNRYSSLGAEMVVRERQGPIQRDQHRPASAGYVHLQLFLPPRLSRRPRRLAAAPLPCGLCFVEIRQGVGTVAQAVVIGTKH